MEIESRVNIVVCKGEDKKHIFRFDMPVGVSYGEAYDACFEALSSVSDMAKQAVENARPEEKIAEDTTPVAQ